MAAFDYIIVGAGTAGSLLALRLAEAGRNSVCVVEAGPEDRNPWLRIPAGFLKTLADTRVTWPFTTEPSPGTNGRSLRLPQGKVLGGTSAINGAIYNRGQAEDFDGWAAAGNPGWAYADVLGYFKRTERRIGAADLALRGTRGALPVSTNRLPIPANLAFIRAAEAQGLPLNPDYNGATQFGVAWTQATIERGWRVSAAHAFLHPARKMGVSVRTRHCVSRLLFDGRKAVGVLCRARDGAEVTIHARREVILCAGTVNSPKLLQLSGIGPPALLGRHGILVLLPLVGVGENLQDHYGVRLTARGKRGMDGINARVQGWRLRTRSLSLARRKAERARHEPRPSSCFRQDRCRNDAPGLLRRLRARQLQARRDRPARRLPRCQRRDLRPAAAQPRPCAHRYGRSRGTAA